MPDANEADLTPADRMSAHLGGSSIVLTSGGGDEAEPEVTPPAAATAKPDATVLEDDDGMAEVRGLIDDLSSKLDSALERREPEREAPRAPATDRLADLRKHPDPEIQTLAEELADAKAQLKAQQAEAQVAREDREYSQLASEEQAFLKDFRFTEKEMAKLTTAWADRVDQDPTWANLTLQEAAGRLVGFDALAARRITAQPTPAPGGDPSPARPSASGRPPGRLVTDAAQGGGPAPPPKLDRGTSVDQSANLMLRRLAGHR